MAGPSNGLTILESDSGDNEDWITGQSGDPEGLTIGNFTSGPDMIYFQIVEKLEKKPVFEDDFMDTIDGASINVTISIGHEEVTCEVSFQGSTHTLTLAKEADLHEFFRKHDELGHNDIYLFERHDTDLYRPFFDNSRAEKKYCKGRFKQNSLSTYIEDRILYAKFVFRSVW